MLNTLRLFLFIVPITLISACNGGDGSKNQGLVQAEGGVVYGGTFRMYTPEKVKGIFPLTGTNAFSRDITYQLFETLLRTDLSTMRTVPHLAKKFEVNESGTLYTLTIRKDVFFHEDACFEDGTRKMTVEDVKFSLEMACSDLPINKMSYLLTNRIRGAAKFNANSKTSLNKRGVDGIRVLNDSMVTIQLVEPFSGFEKILAHANLCIIAPEAFAAYGLEIDKHPVGTGPFKVASMELESLKIEKFEKYWRKDEFGNSLPYLDGVELNFLRDKKKELEEFRDAKVDAVTNIPVDQINYVLGTLKEAQEGANVIHRVLSKSSMSMMYIGFANESAEFTDVRIRRAFNLAVNKTEVVNSYMGGEGWPAQNGFIPPLDFYPNDDVKSLEYNIEKAQTLLAEAGFPEGRGFPPLEVYVNAQENSPNHNMVKGVVNQLNRNLGLRLRIKLCTITERDEAIEKGEAKIWRAGWIADYADPENFLSLFYSRNIDKNNSTINSFHYKNPEFDNILDQANQERNEKIRNQLFVLCDQLIVDDAPVMPVLTEDFIVLLNGRVKNFKPNSMEILDFSSIFMKKLRR